MKKVLSILLALALCVGFILPALAVEDENVVVPEDGVAITGEEASEDEDVPAEEDEDALSEVEEEPAEEVEEPASWAVADINAAVEAGIVPEFLLSSYDAAITRAEFCALGVALYEAVTGSEIEALESFEDTDDVNVSKMATVGVVNGMEDNLFNPDQELTRAQAATILSRLAEALEKAFAEADPTFADNDAIAAWAFGYAGQVQKAGIMVGDNDNNFLPAAGYQRQQAIITVNRLFNYINAEEEVVEEEVVEEEVVEETEDEVVEEETEDEEEVAVG